MAGGIDHEDSHRVLRRLKLPTPGDRSGRRVEGCFSRPRSRHRTRSRRERGVRRRGGRQADLFERPRRPFSRIPGDPAPAPALVTGASVPAACIAGSVPGRRRPRRQCRGRPFPAPARRRGGGVPSPRCPTTRRRCRTRSARRGPTGRRTPPSAADLLEACWSGRGDSMGLHGTPADSRPALVVGRPGLEPGQAHASRILSPMRLPLPPSPLRARSAGCPRIVARSGGERRLTAGGGPLSSGALEAA